MSIEPGSPQAPTEGLQFDRAEFDGAAPAAAMVCSGCQQPIAEQYYDVNGAPFCPTCRDGVERLFTGGSKAGRLIRALVFGGAAATVAAIGYFAFMHFSGMDWSLISIIVGFLVGTAVRKGSRGRGGIPYQAMAVLLTYLSISVTYTAVLISHMARPDPADAPVPVAQKGEAVVKKAAPGDVPVDALPPDADKKDMLAEDDEAPAPVPAPEEVEAGAVPMRPGAMIAIMMGFVLAMPVLMAKASPITALIVGFALWEAWKLNRKVRVTFSGPYRVGAGPGGPPAGDLAHA